MISGAGVSGVGPERRRTLAVSAYISLLMAALCFARADDIAPSGHVAHLQSDLPNAPAKVLVMRYCTSCHGIERVQHSGGSEAGWQDRIQRMIRWGAEIPPGQVESVAAYLASALPVRLRPSAAQAFFANTAVSPVEWRSIQTMVRAAAKSDADGVHLTAALDTCAAPALQVGQRARVFPVSARALMKSARIERISSQDGRCVVRLGLMAKLHDSRSGYLLEIAVDQGEFLTIPNDAVIEEAGARHVYVQDSSGEYLRREVQTGLQGEQFTQVLTGVSAGEQVVTLGSFFIDAEYRMQDGNSR